MPSVLDRDWETLRSRLLKFGNTDKEIKKLMNMPGIGRYVLLKHTNNSVIRLKSLPDKYRFMGTISHEVFHAVTVINKYIGNKMKIGVSDEAYAYCVGRLCELIYKNLNL